MDEFGFSVDEVDSGDAALTFCKGNMPDLILLDWYMPGIDGMEFLKLFRSLPGNQKTKILICTTENDVDKIVYAMSLGAKSLRATSLGVSDADLERGQMRADANISMSATDDLGTRAEVKNLNSFNSVFQAINYEIKRQTELLEKGEKISQETRGWDDAKQRTLSWIDDRSTSGDPSSGGRVGRPRRRA